jgi:hypothetical protein
MINIEEIKESLKVEDEFIVDYLEKSKEWDKKRTEEIQCHIQDLKEDLDALGLVAVQSTNGIPYFTIVKNKDGIVDPYYYLRLEIHYRNPEGEVGVNDINLPIKNTWNYVLRNQSNEETTFHAFQNLVESPQFLAGLKYLHREATKSYARFIRFN